ncbi:hypothetical protein F4861DRAFT_85927 [Xylaria intraflava]|nr:hypothetical protein F4861DRAFT_85927 [Xylaria intraflava]
MLCHTAYTLLVAGLAGWALAESRHQPYRPKLVHMAATDVMGIYRRVIEGYSPIQQLCGDGDTCAEACGMGFEQCASRDGMAHCYNPLKKQTCCPSGRGDSCDDGYFCTADDGGETWCCPEGLSLEECARKYGLPGPLTSQGLPTLSSTVIGITTGAAGTVTKSTTIIITTGTSSATGHSHQTSVATGSETTESTSATKTQHRSASNSQSGETIAATSTQSSSTLLVDTGITPSPTMATTTPSLAPTSSSTPSSGGHGPVNNIVLCIAGVLAALI